MPPRRQTASKHFTCNMSETKSLGLLILYPKRDLPLSFAISSWVIYEYLPLALWPSSIMQASLRKFASLNIIIGILEFYVLCYPGIVEIFYDAFPACWIFYLFFITQTFNFEIPVSKSGLCKIPIKSYHFFNAYVIWIIPFLKTGS